MKRIYHIFLSAFICLWQAPTYAESELIRFFRSWSEFNREMRKQALTSLGQGNQQQQQPGVHINNQDSSTPVDYSQTTLADIRGTIPQEIYDLRDFLLNSQAFADAGAQTPKGVLLVGPPGTGKTSLVRALAGELNVPFITASGSGFIEKYVGVGPQRVRELFETARTVATETNAQHVIIFIDELDAIGTRKATDDSETHRTINELLVQMDGFTKDSRIIVVAATNKVESIDPALRRPGRFDYIVNVGLPNLTARRDILTYYLTNPRFKRAVEATINYTQLAHNTVGFSGAELESMVNRAAINAGREKRVSITQVDLENALASMKKQN